MHEISDSSGLFRQPTSEASSEMACVLASCLQVCRALPRCNVTSCRTNVDALVRHVPRDPCGRGGGGGGGADGTPARRRRRRWALRLSAVGDGVLERAASSKRGYSDATDYCLAYNCGPTVDRTNYEYIQCAIRHQCGLLW